MDKPKEVDAEMIRRVMGHLGSRKTEKKSRASSANLAKAREVKANIYRPATEEEKKRMRLAFASINARDIRRGK